MIPKSTDQVFNLLSYKNINDVKMSFAGKALGCLAITITAVAIATLFVHPIIPLAFIPALCCVIYGWHEERKIVELRKSALLSAKNEDANYRRLTKLIKEMETLDGKLQALELGCCISPDTFISAYGIIKRTATNPDQINAVFKELGQLKAALESELEKHKGKSYLNTDKYPTVKNYISQLLPSFLYGDPEETINVNQLAAWLPECSFVNCMRAFTSIKSNCELDRTAFLLKAFPDSKITWSDPRLNPPTSSCYRVS